MKHQATQTLFRYWNDLRGERSAPERNEFDPGAVRHILADTFIVEIDDEHRFPFRLAGTRVNALFDADQKGRSILEICRPEEARNLAGILLTVADGACPVVAGAAGAPTGHPECALELLFLPMRHYGKTHSRILGIIKMVDNPAWLGLLPVGPLSLRSLRIVESDAYPERRRAVQATPSSMQRGMLRLIEGGLSTQTVRGPRDRNREWPSAG